MADANDLVRVIQQISTNAYNGAKPCDVLFGTVMSVSPIRINVEQRMELGAAQLILTKDVSDYQVEVTGAEGKQSITVHNALKEGEKVILLRKSGGQQFVVVGRLA